MTGRTRTVRKLAVSLMASLTLATAGCASVGVARMELDRFDYSEKLRETNKEQLLMNIVAVRYGDAPAFLEVSSVISQYSREGSFDARLDLNPPGDNSPGNAGGRVSIRETPTVTYSPLSGDRFARSMLTPLQPAALLAMIEAGWAPEYLLRLAASSINGVGNGGHDPLFTGMTDERFISVLEALGRLQRSGGLRIHVSRLEDGSFVSRGSLSENMSDRDRDDYSFIVDALSLPSDQGNELAIRFGSTRDAANELAIQSRSLFEILMEMGRGVEMPGRDDDWSQRREPGSQVTPAPVTIHSGADRPNDAHVAIRYRDSWFWIDHNDLESKRMFLIVQILLSLNDTTNQGTAPLLTVPAG